MIIKLRFSYFKFTTQKNKNLYLKSIVLLIKHFIFAPSLEENIMTS